MPEQTYTLIGLGVGAIVLVWLVFSILKKVFGFVLLVGLAIGAYYLWTNPDALRALTAAAMDLVGR